MKLVSVKHILICFVLLSTFKHVLTAGSESTEVDHDCREVVGDVCNKQGACHSNGVCICKPNYYGLQCEQSFNNRQTIGGMTMFIIVVVWLLIPFCCLGCVIKLGDTCFESRSYRARSQPSSKRSSQHPFSRNIVKPPPPRPSVQVRPREEEKGKANYLQSQQYQPKQQQQVSAQKNPFEAIKKTPRPNYLFEYAKHLKLSSNAIILQEKGGKQDLSLPNMRFISAEQTSIQHWDGKGNQTWVIKEGNLIHKSEITNICYCCNHANGKRYVFTADKSGKVIIWLLGKDEKLAMTAQNSFQRQGTFIHLLAFIENGKVHLASSGDNPTANVPSGGLQIIADLDHPEKKVNVGDSQKGITIFDHIKSNNENKFLVGYRNGEVKVYKYPGGENEVNIKVDFRLISVQFDRDLQAIIVAGSDRIKFYMGADPLFEIKTQTTVTTMKTIYCKQRSQNLVLVSQNGKFSIFKWGEQQEIAAFQLQQNERIFAIDGYYDWKKKKVVFVTSGTNEKCRVYEF